MKAKNCRAFAQPAARRLNPLLRSSAIALALGLILADAADATAWSVADCGLSGSQRVDGLGQASCLSSGLLAVVDDAGNRIRWNIEATASTSSSSLGLLGGSSVIRFNDLLTRNAGASSAFPAFADTFGEFSGRFSFNVPGAAPGDTYRLVFGAAMNGTVSLNIDPQLFAQGGFLAAGAVMDPRGWSLTPGAPSELGRIVQYTGSAPEIFIDDYGPSFFYRNVQVNNGFSNTLEHSLRTNIRLHNGAVSGPGIGSGEVEVGFLATAGFTSFELFDASGAPVEFSFVSETPGFTFYVPHAPGPSQVPEPGSLALLLCGLAGLSSVSGRRRAGSG